MIYLFLAALCSATLTLVLKLFRNPKGNRFGIILGNYLTCVLIAFLQMPEKGKLFSVSSSTESVPLQSASSICRCSWF